MTKSRVLVRRSVAGTKEDPTTPFTTVTLRGKVWKLIYSFNSLARAEAATGVNMFQELNLNALSVVQLRAMLWAALLVAHPDMTLEGAGDLIGSHVDCNIALDAIALAWMASFPNVQGKSPN